MRNVKQLRRLPDSLCTYNSYYIPFPFPSFYITLLKMTEPLSSWSPLITSLPCIHLHKTIHLRKASNDSEYCFPWVLPNLVLSSEASLRSLIIYFSVSSLGKWRVPWNDAPWVQRAEKCKKCRWCISTMQIHLCMNKTHIWPHLLGRLLKR